MRRHFTRRLVRMVARRTSDGAGGFDRDWVPSGAIWADVKVRSGGQRTTELGEEPRLRLRIVTHAVPVGHAARPGAGDRLLDGSRLYEVEAVHEADAERRYLTCFANEVTERRAP